jgi:hypothetical protein
MSNKDSIFIFSKEQNLPKLKGKQSSLKIDHIALSSHIKSEKDHSYTIGKKHNNIFELEISNNTETFEFISKFKTCTEFTTCKAIPSRFLRSVLIYGINELAQIGDIFYSLKKLTNDIKNIHYFDDPLRPGLNSGFCVIEYESFASARSAINIINNTTASNYYYRTINNGKNLNAYWVESSSNVTSELILDYLPPVYFFENLNINTYNVFHLKNFLEEYFKCKVKKLRQYGQKVLVEFNEVINAKANVHFEGKTLQITHAMKPNSNIQRYREKVHKALPYQMTEYDRRLLLAVYDDSAGYLNENLKRKAEYVIMHRNGDSYVGHKREREKKESNIRDDSRDKRRDSRDNKRSRDDDYKKRREYSKDKEYSRDRDYSKGKSRERNATSRYKEREESQSTSTNNTVGGNNIVTQLASLLLNNANNFQGLTLSNLANINTLLSNPGLLSTIQQLSNLQGGGNPNTGGGLVNQNLNKPMNTQMQNIPNTANNNTNNNAMMTMNQQPNYGKVLPEMNNIMNNQMMTQSPSQGYYNTNYIPPKQQPTYFNNNQQSQYQNYNPELYMQGGYNPIDPNTQQTQEDMMKKYYEYMQNININK